MSRQALLPLVLVIFGGLAALFLLRGGEGVETSGPSMSREDAEARGTEPLESATAPGPDEGPASTRVEATSTRRLAGRVVLPQGTPSDEELWVTAHASGAEFEAPVTSSGSFELALSADAERGDLDLRGHYVYLSDQVPYNLDDEAACVLHPELGARIGVEALPPGELRADWKLAEATTVAVSTRRGAGRAERSQGLDANWSATIDAVPIDRDWYVRVSNPHLYDQQRGPLLLEPGQHLRLRLDMIRGTRLAGRVRHADGRPAAGCEVTAQSISDTGLFAVDASTQACDSSGAFDFEGQRPGLYALFASAEGTTRARIDVERLEDGEERTDLELVLGEGDRLAGHVVWPDNRPAAGAEVIIGSQYRGGGSRVAVETDAEGYFEGIALTGPPYRVRAMAAAEDQGRVWRALLDDVHPDRGELELVLRPGNLVSGRVLDDTGRPIERFKVRAQQVGGGNASNLEAVSERFNDEEGRFAVSDLPDGDWSLTASAAGHGDCLPRRLSLPALAGAQWELVLPREANVGGRVLDPHGAPASGGAVRAPAGFSAKTTEVTEGGTYLLEGLAPGEYALSARGPDSTWGPSQIVQLAPGEQSTGVDLTAARAGRIAGVLHSSISDREGRQVRLANLEYTFNADATTDADGRFDFDGLAPDGYRVYLDFSSRGGLNREWAEKYAARAEEIVELEEGATREVILGGPREGEVLVQGQLRLGGEPLPNQLVYVYPGPEGMNFPVTAGYAGEDGRFELRLPAPGDYAFTSAPGAEHGFGRRLDVPGQGIFELTIELGQGSIAGVVLGPDGEPRPAHALLLRRAAAIPDSRRPGDMLRTTTDADGTFLFTHLEDGRWELRSGGSYNDHQTRSEGLAIRSDLVIEDASSLEDVELLLRPGAVLAGTCFVADGAPATGARVVVNYADGCRMLPWSGERVDWRGRFYVPAVDPGVVEVYAELGGERSSSARVELTEGQEGYVELSFE